MLPTDARRSAPATQRNREVILDVLARVLPPSGLEPPTREETSHV